MVFFLLGFCEIELFLDMPVFLVTKQRGQFFTTTANNNFLVCFNDFIFVLLYSM